MALYQQIYSSLLSNYEAVRLARTQGTPNVVQVERAIPGGPVRPNEISNALLGAVVGMIFMGSIAFLIEYLDDTLKTPEDIENMRQIIQVTKNSKDNWVQFFDSDVSFHMAIVKAGKNDCQGLGGCYVTDRHECAGQNSCRGRGGCAIPLHSSSARPR